MGVLTCATMGLTCYINWTYSRRFAFMSVNTRELQPAQQGFRMAYVSLYLASVVVAGAFMLKTTMTLRTWRNPAGVSSITEILVFHR
jgi:hypothetical protein